MKLILGRNWISKISIPEQSRRNVYVIGGSQTGKSSLLYNVAHQLIQYRQGMGLVDVHGDLSLELEAAIYHLVGAKEKERRVFLLDPTRGAFGFNPLEILEGAPSYPQILELMSVFERRWREVWGARMEDVLRNSFLVMAENGLTMCEIPKLLTNPVFRRALLSNTKNEGAREYFEERFERLPKKEQATWIESSLNKISAFVSDPLIREVIGQQRSTINFRQILDTPGAVLLMRLPKGVLKTNAFLLGGLLLAKLTEAALSRADVSEKQRRKFTLIVDECQNFALQSLGFQECLSECQKYGLSIILAHQNLDQLNEELIGSILGNTDCQISFRISRRDAEVIAKEIFKVDIEDLHWERQNDLTDSTLQEQWEEYFNSLTSLKQRQAYCVIKGQRSHRMATLTKPSYNATDQQLQEQAEQVMARYCRPRDQIRQEQAERVKELTQNEITLEVEH